MSIVAVTNIVDGTTGDAADVNSQVNTIVSDYNGNIDNSNIAAAAAIAGSKLADASINIGTKASAWDGWIAVSDSWAYASATTITVPAGAASKYSVGDKIKMTNTGTKYLYIVTVADTLLTVTGGSDYTVANAAISAIYYSKAETPLSFPQYFAWTPTLSGRFDDAEWTKACRFTIHGRKLSFELSLLSANATPMGGGTANAIFTLPVTSAAIPNTDTRQVLGTGFITDASATGTLCICLYGSTTTGIIYSNQVSAANLVITAITSTSPQTWASDDEISIIGSYEIA